MTDKPVPVSIQILDKEYMVSCTEEEREGLMESARYLDRKMREAREHGKVLGTERLAVMTALNLTHEYLRSMREEEAQSEQTRAGIKRLADKIDGALGRRVAEEAID